METPAGAIYHVARDGQVIGAFSFPTLAAKFKDGSVKTSDHYLVEGTSDWKLVSDLKPQFAAHERQLKAEADQPADLGVPVRNEARSPEAARRDAAIEARRQQQRLDQLAQQQRALTWQCATCHHNFTSEGKAQPYPISYTLIAVLACGVVSYYFLQTSFDTHSVSETRLMWALSVFFGIAGLGYLIAFGVETGLQRFHSYRPRCPKCSSPYCSNQGD